MEPSATIRRVSQVLWWVGLSSLLIGGAALALPLRLPPDLPIGLGLVVLGVNIVLNGELVAGPETRPFSARGQVVRGRLAINAGLSDVSIGVCQKGRVAAVNYGPLGKPDFEVIDGVAHLRLRHSFNLSRWQTDLANNVLWDIEARSWAGNLNCDLRDLRIDTVQASTALGCLSITPPLRGYVRIDLRSLVGEIRLHIPPEVGVRLYIQKGRLATLSIHNQRVLALSTHRYATPQFDTAQAQADIRIRVAAGDITLS